MPEQTDDLQRRLARIEDERAIERLIYSYGHVLDFGSPEDYLDLFAENGVLQVESAVMKLSGAGPETMSEGLRAAQKAMVAKGAIARPDGFLVEGRDSLLAFVTREPSLVRSLHVSTQAMVTLIDDDHAKANTYLRIYRAEPATKPVLTALGRYIDDIVRTKNGWRFLHRVCQL